MIAILTYFNTTNSKYKVLQEMVRDILIAETSKVETLERLVDLEKSLTKNFTLLVKDTDFDGFVVKITDNLTDVEIDVVTYTSFERTLKGAELVWSMLGDTPTNDEEEIDEDFLCFQKGVDIYEIWHWVEETFNVSVAKDLMGLE